MLLFWHPPSMTFSWNPLAGFLLPMFIWHISELQRFAMLWIWSLLSCCDDLTKHIYFNLVKGEHPDRWKFVTNDRWKFVTNGKSYLKFNTSIRNDRTESQMNLKLRKTTRQVGCLYLQWVPLKLTPTNTYRQLEGKEIVMIYSGKSLYLV